MLIDSHAHLQNDQIKDDVSNVILRAENAGVEKIVCVGYDILSSRAALEIARKYKQVYAVVGVHPHDAQTLDKVALEELYEMGKDPRVLAIGEIGLDFYRDLSPREQQKKAFIEQIKLAKEIRKPIVIHDRDAHQEVMDIIKKEKAGSEFGGVMHCYSGHLPMALELIKLGFYISFAGPLTFKNNIKTHEVAARLPLDKVILETDCPYLAPEPFRGKRNEPQYVHYIARKLAEIRGKTYEEIAYLTTRNARNIFRIKD